MAFPNTHISRVEKMSGIFRFLTGKNNWDIEMRQKALKQSDLDGADGVLLTGLSSIDSIPAIETSNIPAVLIAAMCSRRHNVAIINTSAAAIGKQTAEQFILLGIYKSYACLHPETPSRFSRACAHAFAAEVMRHGGVYGEFFGNIGDIAAMNRPVALFAFNDDIASQAINRCHALGLSVPGDVSVMGFGNDAMTCETHHPTISSVEPDFELQGYLAAMHLERMMSRRAPSPRTEEFVGIKRIVFRESTPYAQGNAGLVRRAMAFIKANINMPIGVMDVVAYLGVSRRLVEIRFREVRNETVLDAIRNTRLDATKAALAASSDTIAYVCEKCGWRSENAPKKLFRQRFGMSMSDYRARLGAAV